MVKLTGTGVALVTPFDKKLRVDFRSFGKLLSSVSKGGVHYLVVHGTTGETATTTLEEKREILTFVRAHNPNKLPIVYGIGGNHTHEVVKIIESTDFQGIDAILVVSPYYNKPSQEGIYRHYKLIADICPVPLLLYNVPSRTGSNIQATTTLQLSKHPNIIGIKEASGDLLQCIDIAQGKPHDFLLISGEDMLTAPMIAIGAAGVISTVANCFPQAMSQMVNFALQGNYVATWQRAFTLLRASKLISQAGNPVGTKQLLKALGLCQSYVRLPLVPAASAIVKEARAIAEQSS